MNSTSLVFPSMQLASSAARDAWGDRAILSGSGHSWAS